MAVVYLVMLSQVFSRYRYIGNMKNKLLKDIKGEKGSIREQLLEDAEGDVSYIKDVAEHGCIGGNCRGLVYYEETHKWYNERAEEIDGILEELAEQMGESYDITANMKRLGQSDLRNFLAWLAYEVRAQEIMQELES